MMRKLIEWIKRLFGLQLVIYGDVATLGGSIVSI